MKTEDELKARFEEHCRTGWVVAMPQMSMDSIFGFFYSEIEAREKEIKDLEASEDELCTKVRKEQDEAVRVYNQGEERDKIRLAEIQRLEEIIKAADEVVQRGYSPGSVDTSGFGENDKYYEALEHYNKLKSKLPSGI